MKREWVRPLFVIAAIYDLVLGIAYFVGYKAIYQRFGVTLPNHEGYVQLPAALITIFGLGFWYIARAPERNRDLIKLGVLMKLAFAAIVLGHYFLAEIPTMWVPFAICDVLFMIGFLMALRALPAPVTKA